LVSREDVSVRAPHPREFVVVPLSLAVPVINPVAEVATDLSLPSRGGRAAGNRPQWTDLPARIDRGTNDAAVVVMRCCAPQ
jgi:hypothetical protein